VRGHRPDDCLPALLTRLGGQASGRAPLTAMGSPAACAPLSSTGSVRSVITAAQPAALSAPEPSAIGPIRPQRCPDPWVARAPVSTGAAGPSPPTTPTSTAPETPTRVGILVQGEGTVCAGFQHGWASLPFPYRTHGGCAERNSTAPLPWRPGLHCSIAVAARPPLLPTASGAPVAHTCTQDGRRP
jgi:hypothetical protein